MSISATVLELFQKIQEGGQILPPPAGRGLKLAQASECAYALRSIPCSYLSHSGSIPESCDVPITVGGDWCMRRLSVHAPTFQYAPKALDPVWRAELAAQCSDSQLSPQDIARAVVNIPSGVMPNKLRRTAPPHMSRGSFEVG